MYRPSVHVQRTITTTTRRSSDSAIDDVEASSRSSRQALILGGVDGITTTFAIISGGIGGSISISSISIIAISSLIADGLSMGVSEALSASQGSVTRNDLMTGVVCGVSFVCFGVIPLAIFLGLMVLKNEALATSLSAFAGVLLLALLGYLKRTESTVSSRNSAYTIFQTVGLGTAASVIAFLIGFGVNSSFSTEEHP